MKSCKYEVSLFQKTNKQSENWVDLKIANWLIDWINSENKQSCYTPFYKFKYCQHGNAFYSVFTSSLSLLRIHSAWTCLRTMCWVDHNNQSTVNDILQRTSKQAADQSLVSSPWGNNNLVAQDICQRSYHYSECFETISCKYYYAAIWALYIYPYHSWTHFCRI